VVNLILGQATNVGFVTNVQNVVGSAGNSVIVGGPVAGILTGGAGRNLIIGHTAGSTLQAGGGDSILIGGATDHDANPVALNALMKEWTSFHTAGQRRSFLTNGGGFNGPFRLDLSTVHANGAYSLYASLNPTVVDWLFFHSPGDIKQSEASDFFTTI
jgi:Ca2+-binding RTX toxin-like protein